MNRAGPLPIDDVLPEVLHELAAGTRLVLAAPPGAGKTTRVPLALLDQDWVGGRRIIMLEPRRLAARAAAAWMARLLGEQVGDTVGYRVRMDSRVSDRTRIEVVTEGVLTRMLQHDPSLDDAAVVIFDEYHERSLHADLGLALTLQSQALLRPDLRILIMSATLDTHAVARVLDNAPAVRSAGRMYPVDTVYLGTRSDARIEDVAATATRRALERHDGDVLVFLPGAAEIRRTAERLSGAAVPADTRVLQLFGDLSQDEQDRAIAPGPPGTRKVVLATAIAETSLTIEGVRIVIDSGLMRMPRFSPRTGMTRLVTVPVSRAAADQRRGRAGRLGPGICYRLWTEPEHSALLAHRPAEILEADLAPLALELAVWGVADPLELRWIDSPPAAAYAQARELLLELEAVDHDGRVTAHGRGIADLGLHPRLGHMLLRARALGRGALACDLAALLAERDVLRGTGEAADPDVRLRLPLLRGERAVPPGHSLDAGALRRVQAEARHWRQRLRVPGHDTREHDDDAGLLLAFAYPDRIAQQRGARGRFVLRTGAGAAVPAQHVLAAEEFAVAAEVGGVGRDRRIFLAAPVARSAIEVQFATQIERETVVEWADDTRAVRATERRRLGALVLSEHVVRDVAEADVTHALLAAVRRQGPGILSWSRAAERVRQRLAFLHHVMPDEWPAVSDMALLATLDDWLAPWLGGNNPGTALDRVDPGSALLAWIGWDRARLLDELAPTHIEVPSGSRVTIDYEVPAAPVLAVRLQEMFGLEATPLIAGGRVPLTLHLLSPARRPVQVTRDLASFWRTTYFDVRRDLRGRYPKHYWPENPLEAEPTRRTRPR